MSIVERNQDPSVDEIELVRRTIAQGATDDELKLFVYDCKRRGTHPLDRLVHFTKRHGKYTPIAGIDFMRTRAHATNACAGITDAVFEGDPGSPEFQATVTARRLVQGTVCDFTATARWSEYYPGDAQGFMWRKMPHTMLGKCAEGLALRKGFPQELAGIYAKEEMDQAGPIPETMPEIEPLRITSPPPKPRIGARGLAKAAVVASNGATAARMKFYDAKKDYGYADVDSEWVRVHCESYLQRDIKTIMDLTADDWDHATLDLHEEFGGATGEELPL